MKKIFIITLTIAISFILGSNVAFAQSNQQTACTSIGWYGNCSTDGNCPSGDGVLNDANCTTGVACCTSEPEATTLPPNTETACTGIGLPGYCSNDGSCPSGVGLLNDINCTTGVACCAPPPENQNPPEESSSNCGSWDSSIEQCLDSGDNQIVGGNKCERNSSVCCLTEIECDNVFPVENIIKGPNNEFFDALNPLKTHGTPEVSAQLTTPGGIISRVLLFLFPIAGLILFVMLVWGGFEILSKSTSGTKGMEAGKNRITAAIVGFLLLFATYWMAQIIEVVFGIVIV